jgi:hypothetical protein
MFRTMVHLSETRRPTVKVGGSNFRDANEQVEWLTLELPSQDSRTCSDKVTFFGKLEDFQFIADEIRRQIERIEDGLTYKPEERPRCPKCHESDKVVINPYADAKDDAFLCDRCDEFFSDCEGGETTK